MKNTKLVIKTSDFKKPRLSAEERLPWKRPSVILSKKDKLEKRSGRKPKECRY